MYEVIDGKKYFNGKEYIKIGSTELYLDEAMQAYEQDKYLVTYSKVYQLFYSQAQQTIYGKEVYYQRGLCGRGRHFLFTGDHVNKLIGFELLA